MCLLMTDAVEKSVTNGEFLKIFFQQYRPEGHIAAPQQANPSLLIDHFVGAAKNVMPTRPVLLRYCRSTVPRLCVPLPPEIDGITVSVLRIKSWPKSRERIVGK